MAWCITKWQICFFYFVILQVVEEEITVLFTEHVEFLFSLIKQTNNVNNIHVRSIAASCLSEIELFFPVSVIIVLCSLWSCSIRNIGFMVSGVFIQVILGVHMGCVCVNCHVCWKFLKQEMYNMAMNVMSDKPWEALICCLWSQNGGVSQLICKCN